MIKNAKYRVFDQNDRSLFVLKYILCDFVTIGFLIKIDRFISVLEYILSDRVTL